MAQSTQNMPPEPPGPPPPPEPPTWPPNAITGVRDVAPPDRRPDLIAGFWVTSYTGWQLFNPLPEPLPNEPPPEFEQRVRGLPPLIGGQGWTPPQPYDPDEPGSYYLREGYFLCSALLRLGLDGYGHVTGGVMEFIRGGRGYKRRIIRKKESSYTVGASPELPGTYEGTITETHDSDNPAAPTTFTYAFVMRDFNELHWIWKEGSYRPMVASGIFKRIRSPFF